MKLPKLITDNSTIQIPAGVHLITEPITIRGKHIRIVGEDSTVLRGSMCLKHTDFTEEEPGVFSAEVTCLVDGLYISGRKYKMARYPKQTDPNQVFGGYASDCLSPEKIRQWADPTGGYIHAIHAQLWGGYSYHIDGKNPDDTLRLSGGWQNNRQMGMHDDYRFAENIREEMTEPGEWYYCEKEGRIYLRLVDGDSLDQTEVVVSSGFFILENCEDVAIENLIFEHSARTFMETKEPLLRSDWTICRKGAVLMTNSSHCILDKCTFRDIGSNGVFVDGNSSNITISRSHFRDIGASGICFVGRSTAVRSPLFEYSETQSAANMDKIPGPKTEDYPKFCTVEDCLIEHVGITEKQSAGVEISIAFGVTVKNCTICHTSRAGINISEGTFGGHCIEGCDVFDTVRETGDHGSFNSWGRDRYWHLSDVDDSECGNYAALDMLKPNIITRNRFRCDHGWDIDLDDGSSFYNITKNLCLCGGIKLREGFGRVVRNNITVENTVHLHVWYPKSADVVENNIMFHSYYAIAMPPVWGESLNHNIIYTPGQMEPIRAEELMALSGQDEDSICLDVGFRSTATMNYTPTNPYVSGFEDFPTVFGVRYAPLRALADTPVNSNFACMTTGAEDNLIEHILDGATLRNIANDGEMSVYGTSGREGALVLAVEGAAAERGLCAEDVIIMCNNSNIHSVEDLPTDIKWGKCSIVVLRKQLRIEL